MSVEVKHPTDGLLGYVQQLYEGSATRFVIKDETGETVLQLFGPHICCNCSCKCENVDYDVKHLHYLNIYFWKYVTYNSFEWSK